MRQFSFDGELISVPEANLKSVGTNPLVSVVLTSFKRAAQLRNTLVSLQDQTYKNVEIIVVEADFDEDLTRRECERFNVHYLRRLNTSDRRTAVTNNVGIRHARGEIILLQCAECRHDAADTIERLIQPIIANPNVSTVPRVLDLDKAGRSLGYKLHPTSHPHCFITFCQAFAREAVVSLGGFDEEYVGWGLEDNDFNFRLQFSGVKCRHVDAQVSHQWHESVPQDEIGTKSEYYAARLCAIKDGTDTIVANVGRDWGNPAS